MAKQDWKVTIKLEETEGDSTSTVPWYSRQDIENLIRGAFVGRTIRDLKIEGVDAEEVGAVYI